MNPAGRQKGMAQGRAWRPLIPQSLTQMAMIAAYGAVGVSAFAVMAAGPRVLGDDGYSSLALVWTLVTIIGVGIATPGEQIITPAVASKTGAGTVVVVARRFAVVTPVTVALIPFLAADHSSGASTAVWLATVALSTIGWMALAVVRGILAGRQRFDGYAATLFLEAVCRVVFVALAFIPGVGMLMLALSVAVPLLVSAGLGWYWTRSDDSFRELPVPVDSRLEHASATGVALLIQICLSTAQIWLGRQSADPAIVGAFVTATSYMRIPTMLASGLYAPLIARIAEAYSAGSRALVLKRTANALALGVGGSAVLSVALLAVSQFAMLILYGGDPGLPTSTYLWLAIGSVGLIAGGLLTNALYGCRRASLALIAWLPSAAITTLLFANAGGDPTTMAVGAAVGQFVAVVLLLTAFTAVMPKGSVAKR